MPVLPVGWQSRRRFLLAAAASLIAVSATCIREIGFRALLDRLSPPSRQRPIRLPEKDPPPPSKNRPDCRRTGMSRAQIIEGHAAVLLFSNHPQASADAARCLGDFGPEAWNAIPALQRSLSHPDMGTGKAALRALRKIAPKTKIPEIVRRLGAPSPEARIKAAAQLRFVVSLHPMENAELEQLFRELLKDPEPKVRFYAADYLASHNLAEEVVVPTLLRMLDEEPDGEGREGYPETLKAEEVPNPRIAGMISAYHPDPGKLDATLGPPFMSEEERIARLLEH